LSGVSYARVLIGWSNQDRSVVPGGWTEEGYFAVLETRKGKFLVYRAARLYDEPRTGTIQVYNSWRELEAAVPARIFEEA